MKHSQETPILINFWKFVYNILSMIAEKWELEIIKMEILEIEKERSN